MKTAFEKMRANRARKVEASHAARHLVQGLDLRRCRWNALSNLTGAEPLAKDASNYEWCHDVWRESLATNALRALAVANYWATQAAFRAKHGRMRSVICPPNDNGVIVWGE